MNNTILTVLVLVAATGAYFLLRSDSENTAEIPLATTGEGAEVTNETFGEMSFFITSENPGTGANYDGLAGADNYCKLLAASVGAGDKTWRAYLSAATTSEAAAVHARDRIGSGPWYNAAGVLIANDVDELHETEAANLHKETGLSEKGEPINGRGDTPNQHDILTGSNADGTLAIAEGDTTCSNWTSEDENGSAIVGHHDRLGLDTPTAASWNASHASRGCGLPNLNNTGGAGLLYCFAAN